jgi:hypothetical protein
MLRVSSSMTDESRGRDELSVEYSGPEVAVHVNGHFLIEAIESMDHGDLTLGANGPSDPIALASFAQRRTIARMAIVMVTGPR